MKNIIQVISGKGGVGKSTVSVNLAVALAKSGKKVALIDADFYGPSIPTLMGGGEIKPDHNEKLIPAEKFGVKYVSIGFFLGDPDDPVIWRGPMFAKALNQLFFDVNWGDVDVCVVDMPPGTGDAALSLAQMVQLTGSVVVTTPQEVALADVRKAINMLAKVNVPLLGIVENMAGFQSSDGTVVDIFGAGGGEAVATKFNVPLLASIPILVDIRKGGDLGSPAAFESNPECSEIFSNLAQKLDSIVENSQNQQSRVSVVN